MSQDQETLAIEGATGDGIENFETELDNNAEDLLAELEKSQLEIQQLLTHQHGQEVELSAMRDQLASELSSLQQEAWKLQAAGELEVLKKQLEELVNLETDLDAMEALLGAGEQQDNTSAAASTSSPPAKDGTDGASPTAAGGGGGVTDDDIRALIQQYKATRLTGNAPKSPSSATTTAAVKGSSAAKDSGTGTLGTGSSGATAEGAAGGGDGGDYDAEFAACVAEQEQLEKELQEMMAQLTAVRSEAEAVSRRKANLQNELEHYRQLQEALAAEEAAAADLIPVGSPDEHN